MNGTYQVSVDTMERLLQVLKPLGETIQLSAHQREPVIFDKSSLMKFGQAVQGVESEVTRQRTQGANLFGK